VIKLHKKKPVTREGYRLNLLNTREPHVNVSRFSRWMLLVFPLRRSRRRQLNRFSRWMLLVFLLRRSRRLRQNHFSRLPLLVF
jgi:hypothetical protein